MIEAILFIIAFYLLVVAMGCGVLWYWDEE